MTSDKFRASLEGPSPPEAPPLLVALWHDRRGDWNRAHVITQDIESSDAAWVHAYLHRRDGDLGNARYWYRRAGRAERTDSLDAEWEQLVEHLLRT
jgi:hypothetical protein